jgi:putative alpha-1,2-mannosidase
VWNQLLKRIDVLDAGQLGDWSNRHLDVFYTGLFRALSFPRRIDELDAQSER